MASMKLAEQLEEQPPEKKPRIDNCQKEGENASNPNDSELPKSVERDNVSESINLPPSVCRHRKLPAELNQQIFYCLNLATRRKFICGLGWDFYAMFRQILLKKSKRLRTPEGNAWRSNGVVTISEDGLIASNNHTNGRQNIYIYAMEGFPISGEHCREDNFPGTICYYYEVKILKSILWCKVGLTDGEILPGGWIGRSPNSYAIVIHIPTGNFYQFHLAGERHRFELPNGVIRPGHKETGNVAGCGILMNPNDKLTIFFTFNGILMDRQIPIDPTVDHLFPSVPLWDDMSLEANFGDNPAKPFEYDITKCPGMGLEWI